MRCTMLLPVGSVVVAERARPPHSESLQSRLTIAIRVHLILAAPSRVFNRDVQISITFSSGLRAFKSAAFLSSVYLFAQAHQELVIHHSVQRQQGTRSLLSAIQTLCDRVDENSVLLEPVTHAQHVGQTVKWR